jgi:hypothetical protein
MLPRHRARLWVQALEDRCTPTTFTVSNALDSGTGSLRQAITDSNANYPNGPDTITFDATAFSSPQTISLLTALPAIQDNVAITGPGSGLVTVMRNAGAADNFRILTIGTLNTTGQTGTTYSVSIQGMKLTQGMNVTQSGTAYQTDNGGGILVGTSDTVSLTDVVVSQCTSNAQGGGIAVADKGHLTMANCTVSGNTAQGLVNGDPFGFGFSGVGGGVYFTLDGTLTMTGCTISGNAAKYRGGGVYLYADTSVTATIRNCTISNNKTTTYWSGATLYSSGGGGISTNINPAISGSTLTLTISNSTIYQNSVAAGSKGGGISSIGNATTMSVESTVVSGNTASTGADISASKQITLNASAVGSSTGFTFTGSNNLAFGSNLMLGALQNNGGLTQTYMPASGSPLVDAGSNSASLTTDQRGPGYVRVYGTKADIGAVEVQPAGLPTAAATSSDVTTAGGTSQTVTVTYAGTNPINVSNLHTGNITVTGPAGFSATPTFTGVDNNTNGTPRVATYTFTPPGGAWTASGAGSYTITINGSPNQVADTTGLAVPPGPIGSFKDLVPRTLVVTNKNDSGPGSLRQAITDANNISPSQDIITFGSLFNTPQTITLTGGAVTISDSVKIIGPGATSLTVDANFTNRHFIIDGTGSLDVQISGMTLTNGHTSNSFQSERGGSIYDNGQKLTLDGVYLTSNQAVKSYGGAIDIEGQGTLIFKNGRLTSNVAGNTSGYYFGGGAISALSPGHTISISNSLIANNMTGLYGGGIFSFGGGTVSIDSSTISNNSTTQFNDQGGTVFGGGGGGLMMGDGTNGGTLTITNSTFDANVTAGYGGGFTFNGKSTGTGLNVINSTIVNNQSQTTTNGVAGGVLVGNLANTVCNFDNDTFAFNSSYSGGGLFIGNNDGNSVFARSTIFAQNSSADPTQLPPDVDGAVHCTNCLLGIVDGSGVDTDPSSTNNLYGSMSGGPLDPLYGTLDFNGGPTRTLSLQTGSPALDVGINPDNLLYDQRGVGYPRVSNGNPDIGAYELQVIPPPTVTNVQIGDGSAQRSTVRSITVTFSTLVNLGGGTPEQAFSLARTGPGSPMTTVGLTADLSGSTATQTICKLTFNGPLTEGAGSLIDGRYVLTVIHTAVLDATNQPMAADNLTNLFRLFGDINGDATVSASDFIAFRQYFGGANSAFDFDGDGSVSATDFIQFRLRFGGSLP